MRVSSLAVLAGLTVWSLAGSTFAGTLTLDFGLSGNLNSPVGPSVPGSTTGTARVVLMGVNALGMITDPSATAALQDLNVQSNLGGIGVFRFSQLTPVSGTFDGTTLGIPVGAFTLAGMSPVGVPGTFTNQAALAVLLTSLGDAAQLMFSGGVGPSDILGFNLVGRQVARNFAAPEPSEVGILVMGLGALAACAAGARRRPSAARAR